MALQAQALTQPSQKSVLFHPWVDVFLLGGGSLIFTVAMSLLRLDPSWLASHLGWLLLVFSYPHFMASYAVFYGAGGPWRQHPLISYVLPIALAGFLGVGVFSLDERWLNGVSQLTLVLVFWHFLKQAFGSALWLGATPGKPMSKAQRELLLLCLLLFGCYGYLAVQASEGPIRVFGTELQSFKLVPGVLVGARWAAYGSMGVFVAWVFGERIFKKEASFRWQGWIPIAALATWLEPSLGGSPTRLILPVFHAIQYMPFPARIQLNVQSSRQSNPAMTWLRVALVGVVLYTAGYLFFYWIPKITTEHLHFRGALRIFAFMQLFFNLHHYFMDAVIWRFSDPTVRGRLFGSAPGECRELHEGQGVLRLRPPSTR